MPSTPGRVLGKVVLAEHDVIADASERGADSVVVAQTVEVADAHGLTGDELEP